MKGLVFHPVSHTYTLDGRRVPSVTQVLKPLHCLDHIPPAVLERKARLGTAVHRACELHLLGTLDESTVSPEVAPYFMQFLRFLDESGFEPALTERQVVSRRYGYAGTLDLWGYLNGRTALPDIKTTFAVAPICGLQTAAYAYALEEETGLETEDRFVLRLTPETYRLELMSDPQDLNVFLSQLNVFKWMQAHD